MVLTCDMSRGLRFPAMWYVRPAEAQTSLRICAVWSEPLLVAWKSMLVKLLTEHHLGFQSLTGGCTDSYESSYVKIPHCWKSHVTAHLSLLLMLIHWWVGIPPRGPIKCLLYQFPCILTSLFHLDLINAVYITAAIFIRSAWRCTFWLASMTFNRRKNP